jgi:hypothetical protein
MKIIVGILLIDFIFRLIKYGPMEVKSFINWWKNYDAKGTWY